ncbi:MAG: metalloregulator ArsR/SmtB family transcription factor, partial [Acidobacteria bacterium]|nr:metalloregulator ArsR/SmtB family transcription factor [Acidobacteriota bacterium]
IVLLLEREELSVAELQEILSMRQSRISTHLAQLKQAGFVEDRRSGKNVLYRAKPGSEKLLRVLREESPDERDDQRLLALALQKRTDRVRAYFDELAGKFGKAYVPGRSWKGLAETLLKLLPPMVIADLGAGEGTMSLMMAQRASQVIAVDNSEKMVEYGSELARTHGVRNLEYRLGDLENPPIAGESVDLAFFSQALHHALHPQRAVDEAFRIVKPGGRIVVLDLRKHAFEQARELYADVWLGFSEIELGDFLRNAGFTDVEISIVNREAEAPNLETVLAVGFKPA